jgi:hypothetical protein
VAELIVPALNNYWLYPAQRIYAPRWEECSMSERARQIIYDTAVITGGTLPLALLAWGLLLS